MSGSRAVLLLLLSIVGSIVSTGLSPLTRVALPDFALIVALYAGLTSRHSGGGLAAQRDASAPDLGHAPPEHRHGDGEAESGHRQHRPEHVAVHRFHRHPRRGASSMCRCCGPPRDPAMGRP